MRTGMDNTRRAPGIWLVDLDARSTSPDRPLQFGFLLIIDLTSIRQTKTDMGWLRTGYIKFDGKKNQKITNLEDNMVIFSSEVYRQAPAVQKKIETNCLDR